MTDAMWNPSMETLPREQLRKLQDERLCETVRRVYASVPFYRHKMQEAGLTPSDIHGVDDLHLLPFTNKTDLRDNYPFGLFAVPQEQIVRIHASSGTTGKQTVVGYTQNDIALWSECTARALTAAGAAKNDYIHVSYGYGLFTGGLGLHYAGELIGAAVIPASSGNTARQIQILRDFGSSIICCTPSYALYIADTLREQNIDPAELRLKAGIFGAEPWSEGLREEIEALAAERPEKLWPALEADGIDEQRKQHRLDTVIDMHAELADDDGGKERTRDAAQLEFAKLKLAEPIAYRQ